MTERKIFTLDTASIAADKMNEFLSYAKDKFSNEHLQSIMEDYFVASKKNQPVTYKFTSTKEYVDAFPCAYRQWRADSHCRLNHGYAFSMKFYFGTNGLDVRNWAADYGGLKELKTILNGMFDHTTLCSADDPELEWYKEAEKRGLMKLTILPRVGCEGLADMLYKYMNSVYIPDNWGAGEAERLWCYRVEVRETQANMAFREGHREWNEDLLSEY